MCEKGKKHMLEDISLYFIHFHNSFWMFRTRVLGSLLVKCADTAMRCPDPRDMQASARGAVSVSLWSFKIICPLTPRCVKRALESGCPSLTWHVPPRSGAATLPNKMFIITSTARSACLLQGQGMRAAVLWRQQDPNRWGPWEKWFLCPRMWLQPSQLHYSWPRLSKAEQKDQALISTHSEKE